MIEWRHPGVSEDELQVFYQKEKKISKMAVEGTISVLRELVDSGKL